MLQKKLFGEVGIEPTFMPLIHNENKYAAITEDMIDTLRKSYLSEVRCFIDDKYYPAHISSKVMKWLRNNEMDEGSMEIPTPFQYKNAAELLADYKVITDELCDVFGIYPSSVIDIETEGGCHVNISMGAAKLRETMFLRNMKAFLNTYPSLVWLNLSPNDNESSNIFTYDSSTGKGDCINFRDGYLELRMFNMPATEEEFLYNLDFANNLMWYIYEETKKGVKIPFKYKAESLEKLKYAEAEQMAKTGLGLLNMDIEQTKRLGKFAALQQRFKYGKNYLL